VLGRVEGVEPAVASVYPRLLTGHVGTRAVPAFDAVMALGERTAHSRLGLELFNVLAVEGTEQIARSLDRVPHHTTMLREVAVWVDRDLLESEQSEEQRARRCNNLGVRLSELGRREEALAATQEAVEVYGKLAQARPDAFLADLASSLNNLGVLLSALGRREEALAATQEAVEVYAKLAQARPDAFLADLATSLGAQGSVLHAMGRVAEASAAFDEGLDCIWGHFERLPRAFQQLTTSLLRDHATTLGDRAPEILAPRLARFDELLSAHPPDDTSNPT
jgi:tetratricopeptide (TPR) repeat protein